MNRWNIPDWLEREVLERDRRCVYCQVEFSENTTAVRSRPSWEHIVNDASLVTRANIARCCIGCNASKGVKPLSVWLESKYCRSRGIAKHTVADVVRDAIASAA
jgi:hypothetical protein